MLGEEIGKDTAHDLSILNDVGDAGRTACVVFQDQKIAIPIAYQIGPANVNVNILRDVEVHELRPETGRLPDVLLGKHAIAQNRLAVINVVQKKIKRGDSLFQTALDFLPFVGGDDPWNQVERKNSLRSLGVAVNREGHALPQKRERSQFALAIELFFLQLRETLEQSFVVRPGLSRRGKHFVVKVAGVVIGEEFDH